jgi:hypothetical protein
MLSQVLEKVATKDDVKAEVNALRLELRTDFAVLRTEFAVLKGEFADQKGQIANLTLEVRSMENRLVVKLGGLMIFVFTIGSALMSLIIKHS